jgi:hypothetical protein
MAVALGGLAPVAHFDHVGEPESLNKRWLTWRDELELFLLASGVTDAGQKKALMLHMGGPGLREINSNFTAADRNQVPDAENADVYRQTKALFNSHFALRQNVPKARQNFIGASPAPGEVVNNYVMRLKTLVSHCEYDNDADNQVRDKVLQHINDRSLKAKLLNEENLTLARMLTLISNHHSSDGLVLVQPEIGRVQERWKKSSAARQHQQRDRQPKANQDRCFRCNATGHLARDCKRSRNHTCEKCNIKGHFAECCRTKDPKKKGKPKHHQGVRSVEDESEGDTQNLSCVFAFKPQSDGNAITLIINETRVKFIIDSGSEHDLLSEKDFQKINTRKPLNLSPSDKKLFTYAANEPLTILGSCVAKVKIQEEDVSRDIQFTVVPNARISLLGHSTSTKFGLLSVGINQVASDTPQQTWRNVQKRYPGVFSGLGKLKNFQLKIKIDPEVKPVCQSHRRVPFSRRTEVSEMLEKLEEQDVIEKVNTPSLWVNPLVTVGKPDGKIRICLDMRKANEAIVRERHPIPTVEETIQEMSVGKLFSKLDLTMAYHLIELHPDSPKSLHLHLQMACTDTGVSCLESTWQQRSSSNSSHK